MAEHRSRPVKCNGPVGFEAASWSILHDPDGFMRVLTHLDHFLARWIHSPSGCCHFVGSSGMFILSPWQGTASLRAFISCRGMVQSDSAACQESARGSELVLRRLCRFGPSVTWTFSAVSLCRLCREEERETRRARDGVRSFYCEVFWFTFSR